jgi:hypothetical protein
MYYYRVQINWEFKQKQKKNTRGAWTANRYHEAYCFSVRTLSVRLHAFTIQAQVGSGKLLQSHKALHCYNPQDHNLNSYTHKSLKFLLVHCGVWGDWVRLSSLGISATIWPIVPPNHIKHYSCCNPQDHNLDSHSHRSLNFLIVHCSVWGVQWDWVQLVLRPLFGLLY